EGYGFDYRMWHLPLCLSCMEVITEVGDSFLLNPDVTLNFHVSPHSLREEEVFWPALGLKNLSTGKKRHHFTRDLQMA
ncbi:MAG: hypothetical protein KC584_19255, partial [Nitrospira sp.]|nr:hypothetical protein [Nitrospira sp.]